MPQTKTAAQTLCEPAQSKRMSRFRKSYCDTEIYKENAAAQSEHSDQALAFTLTVRTPQCGHTVWGKCVDLLLPGK